MKRILFTVAIFTLSVTLNAQTLKTAVLVIGNGNSAWAAGVQSAVSGVKTIILTQNKGFTITDMGLNLHSGIESEFLKRVRKAMKITDSTKVVAPDRQMRY
jgi:alkyl hydroperoxide reductase subunit AhpF